MTESQNQISISTEDIKRKKRAEYYKAWRAKNIEKCREINRRAVAKFRKTKPESMRQIQKRYWSKNPESYLEKAKRYQTKFPIKLKAQALVNRAIARGELVRQPCQHCQNPKSEAHHVDYSKPLEVQWLCKKHHVAWHKLFTAVGGE